MGREQPGDDLKDCGGLAKEFKRRFLDEFASVNHASILKGFGEEEYHQGCVKLTAEATVMLTEWMNEFGNERETSLNAVYSLPREKVSLGTCPFSGCSCS
jgi:hypothetical protein